MIPIPIVLSSLLTSCTEAEKDTASDELDDVLYTFRECSELEYYCWSEELTRDVSTEELEPLLDASGQISEETCRTICTEGYDDVCACTYEGVQETGAHQFSCEVYSCSFPYEGRGNGEICKTSSGQGGSHMARWSARAFHAEASSVAAFLQIRAELKRFGAPSSLQQRCLQASCDEIKHARVMAALTDTLGGTHSELDFGDVPQRSLLDFAIDNVKEGCVNEAYAALCALYQGEVLPESHIKTTLQNIGNDELRHVVLSYDIHRWCMTQLSDEEQELVRAEQKKAFAQLYKNAQKRPVQTLPYPPASVILAMSKALCASA